MKKTKSSKKIVLKITMSMTRISSSALTEIKYCDVANTNVLRLFTTSKLASLHTEAMENDMAHVRRMMSCMVVSHVSPLFFHFFVPLFSFV